MKKILAKSSGISLIDHSKNVSEIALYIAKKSFTKASFKRTIIFDNPDDFYEVVRLSALLHDIGKATTGFQKLLNNKSTKSGNKYLHNEIGWCFLLKYLNVPNKLLSLIIEIVYWHHGIMGKLQKDSSLDISKDIKTDDINQMKSILIDLLGVDYCRLNENNKNINTPLYYYYNDDNDIDALTKNMLLTALRVCVYPADRIVSMFEENGNFTIDDIKKHIDDKLIRDAFVIDDYPTEDKSRFNLQKKIVESCEKTSIPKAPAGFGKTLLGLMWASKTNKKLVWVCPRNSTTRSAYNSICEELTKLNINASVELYLTGEIKEQNKGNKSKPFESDIIVTNIDNFLSPTIDARHSDKLHFLTCADIVFDEFHELCTDSALMAAFVTMIKLRHNYLDVNTLLLSATPPPMSFLWDTEKNITKILPNKQSHYPAAHKEKYNIICSNEYPNEIYDNSICFYNSITQAQINKNNSVLIHSLFEENKKIELYDKLYSQYGKNRNNTQENWTSTHVIQASFDISFLHGCESVMSPEATMQRLGRINRWGKTYDTKSTYRIVLSDEKSELMTISNLYNNHLKKLWFNYIDKHIINDLTLDEFYSIYNKFYIENENIVNEYINDTYNNSLKLLAKIYPIKVLINKKSKTFSAGSNKLRSIGQEIFFISKYTNSDNWTEPFTIRLHKSFTDDFSESDNMFTQIKAVWKKLSEDERYNFNELTENKTTQEQYQSLICKRSNTPYIRFDVSYHEDYGIIKNEILDNLNKI
jgi:CRISPR-associated endonuclease Cas3-HD